MTLQLTKILDGLEFFPENIKKNLELTHGLIMAERIMIALSEKGMGRQEAHELIRTLAQQAFREKRELKELVEEKKLFSEKECERLFDPATYIGAAERIVEEAVKD
jgi:adenylosuccinate lyase